MPTVTVRPSSSPDTHIGSWTLTGAASLLAAVNDGSDSTYATSDTYSNLYGAGGGSIPVGSVLKWVAPVIRYKNVWSGDDGGGLSYGAVGWESIGSVLVPWSSSAFTYRAPSFLPPATSDMWMSFTTRTELVTVYDMWWELVYATAPTAAVSAPTGTVTTTSAPQVKWTHTAGTDGGPQSRYEAKVFSAAQYGAGGFNPSTSTATWASGQTVGSANTVTPPALPNDTYRAYVRTAQTTGGEAQWSDWAYSGFVLAAGSPPVVLSVTATGDDAHARNRIVVARDSSGPAWDHVEVQRSDDGGVSWVPVRGGSVAILVDQWIGYDHEAGNGVPAFYRARGSFGTVVGAYTSSVSSAAWSSPDVWLRNLRYPSQSLVVSLTSATEPEWEISQGVHRAVGRPDPVVISDVRQLSTGSFTVELFSLADELALRGLLDGDAVMLQFPAAMEEESIYLVPGRISRARQTEIACSGWRYITVEYVQVAMPPDQGIAEVGGGLTWADYLAAGTTWADALTAGTTWADLV